MTFLAARSSGVVLIPLFTSSPGRKSGPLGCKADVGSVEIAGDSDDTIFFRLGGLCLRNAG